MDEYITVFTDMYGISEDDRGKAERCIESTIEYIKEGDVTVSYGSNSSSMSSVFKDYKARLARFRKLVW